MPVYIDTRDLAEELDELRERPLSEFEAGDIARMQALEQLADEIGGEWPYGALMVPEDAFESYARELAEDIGAIDRDASWPLSYIDWLAAADALRMDYTTVEFDGTTYYVRP